MTRVKGYPRTRIRTPLGLDLLVESAGGRIVTSRFERSRQPARSEQERKKSRDAQEALLEEARRQVDAYFARKLARFDLPLALDGTPFECAVWQCVADLAFGEFVSYADVARAVGRPFAHRGVARAMGRSPLDLLIPAHRIVGSDGKPRGLSPKGRRAWLIAFERGNSSATYRP